MKVLTSQELLEYARYKAALQSYLPKGMIAVFIEGKFKVVREAEGEIYEENKVRSK